MKGFYFRTNQSQTDLEFSKLESINIDNSFSLVFQAAPELSQLLSVVDKLRNAKNLRVLVQCRGATEADSFDLELLSKIPNIKALVLLSGWKSTTLEPITALDALNHLEIHPGHCKKRSLLPLADCKTLQSVSIWKITSDLGETLESRSWKRIHLEEVKSVKKSATIRCVELRLGACSTEVVEALCHGAINIVSIIANKTIADLTFLEHIEALKSIRLDELPNITVLHFGTIASEIENLWISSLTKLSITKDVENLTNLKYLNITGSTSITKDQLEYLRGLRKLKNGFVLIKDKGNHINVSDLLALKELSPIEHDRLFNSEVDPSMYD